MAKLSVYVDLLSGVSQLDRISTSTLSAVYTGCFALGWALGPIIGSSIYRSFHVGAGGADNDSKGFSAWMSGMAIAALVCCAGTSAVAFLAAMRQRRQQDAWGRRRTASSFSSDGAPSTP